MQASLSLKRDIYNKVIIERDALNVIKAFHDSEEDVQWRGVEVIKEYRKILVKHCS
ncbi:hypothetical protein M9H77_24136 [Catharanthus roseus]|uniref:Uncharacterized protein n=1 Tax=Catharanthus roseus TaxID=4058 RepID=A0ACC0AUZ8_CATRO|nr:hypothetical protein M9H77_24136 [Catharanthus roseus]